MDRCAGIIDSAPIGHQAQRLDRMILAAGLRTEAIVHEFCKRSDRCIDDRLLDRGDEFRGYKELVIGYCQEESDMY